MATRLEELLRNNIMNVANDSRVFEPVAYIAPEIVEYDGKTILHVRVPASGEVYAYKGIVYDRNGDADVRVRSVAEKALMILRKQGVFTERRIYPYVTKADLNLADLKRLRIRAQNNSPEGVRHPWLDMDDDQLLHSAKLTGTDRESGKSGFNLAAVMLLGTEDVIKNICREIGYADQLGSGVRNLFKYAKSYGGDTPQLKDGDVFHAEVSLKSLDIEQKTHLSNGSVKNAVRLLRANGLIRHEGGRRNGRWVALA